MRKLLWIIFVIPVVTHAQFKKGDVYLGASLYRGSEFSAAPFVGFFINPRWALGANVQNSYSRTEGEAADAQGTFQVVSTNRGITAGVTARRFITISDNFYFAIEGELGYQRYTTKDDKGDRGTSEAKTYGTGFTVAPVFIYFPSPRWGIEAGLGNVGYSFNRVGGDVNYQATGLDLGRVSLGFAYYFRK